MIELAPTALAAALAVSEPMAIRTLAFDIPTFNLLKRFQRNLESRICRDTSNAEAVKYLIHTHPEVQATQ